MQPMDLNTASRHRLKTEYGKYIGRAIHDLQEEGPINMSSLVEATDIGEEYWLEEARSGVIKPISEVFVPEMDDLQTRFDNLSLAYTDLLGQLEEERHLSRLLQTQNDDLHSRYVHQNEQLRESDCRLGAAVTNNSYLLDMLEANGKRTRELYKERGHSLELQIKLKEQHSRYDRQEKQKEADRIILTPSISHDQLPPNRSVLSPSLASLMSSSSVSPTTLEMQHSTTSQRSPVHSLVSSSSCILNEISTSSPTPSHPLDVESRSSPVVDLTSDRETSSPCSSVLELAKPSTHTPAASPAKQPRFSPSSTLETPLLAISQRICGSSHAPPTTPIVPPSSFMSPPQHPESSSPVSVGSSSILSAASLHTVCPVASPPGWPATSSPGNSCPASPEMLPCSRYQFGHVYSTMAQLGNSSHLPHASLGEVQSETSSDRTSPVQLSSALEFKALPVTEPSILPMEVQPHMSDTAEPQAQCHTNWSYKSPSPSPPSAPVPSSVAPPPRTPAVSSGASPGKSVSEPASHITRPRLCSASLQTPPSAMFQRGCVSSSLSPGTPPLMPYISSYPLVHVQSPSQLVSSFRTAAPPGCTPDYGKPLQGDMQYTNPVTLPELEIIPSNSSKSTSFAVNRQLDERTSGAATNLFPTPSVPASVSPTASSGKPAGRSTSDVNLRTSPSSLEAIPSATSQRGRVHSSVSPISCHTDRFATSSPTSSSTSSHCSDVESLSLPVMDRKPDREISSSTSGTSLLVPGISSPGRFGTIPPTPGFRSDSVESPITNVTHPGLYQSPIECRTPPRLYNWAAQHLDGRSSDTLTNLISTPALNGQGLGSVANTQPSKTMAKDNQ